VRPILKAYQGKDIPVEYATREAEDKLVHLENWKKKGGGRGVPDVKISSWFSVGRVRTPFPSLQEKYLIIKTPKKT
jgi:hypothetical protein